MQTPTHTLLVVDDVPENISSLKGILKDDYKIKVATNGRKALEIAAAESPPDLILLDIMMPEMDGYTVCERLKADPATEQIPVIFLTAKSDEADETKGLGLGAVDYITKPISPAIVLARVQTHLQLASAMQELRKAAELRERVEQITRHDLKGPLNGIITIPEMLLAREPLSDQGRKLLELTRDAGYQMLDMINRSLDLYKMEMGVYRYQPHAVNLVEVARKILAEQISGRSARGKQGELLLDGHPPQTEERLPVAAEELLCHSMLSNLARNAFEAAPRESTIRVELFSPSADESRVVLRITNTGAVPIQIRGSFFDKFTTYGKSHGTGLGTYSAKLCAQTMDGEIRLDTSAEEDRTTIEVRLPTGVGLPAAEEYGEMLLE